MIIETLISLAISMVACTMLADDLRPLKITAIVAQKFVSRSFALFHLPHQSTDTQSLTFICSSDHGTQSIRGPVLQLETIEWHPSKHISPFMCSLLEHTNREPEPAECYRPCIGCCRNVQMRYSLSNSFGIIIAVNVSDNREIELATSQTWFSPICAGARYTSLRFAPYAAKLHSNGMFYLFRTLSPFYRTCQLSLLTPFEN